MAGLWRTYLRLLEKHPWKTQVISTATLMSMGDVLAQVYIEDKKKDYDIIRTARFFFFGTIYVGPALRTWYLTMERIIGVSRNTALLKVAADQGCFAPVFLSTFIAGMEFLRGGKLTEIKNKIKQDFVPVLITNYKIWPAVQICNFYLVPFHLRILVVNITALGWNTYLAWMSEQDQK